MRKALITGITGQDGSYLTALLLEKNYEVHGILRRASTFNTDRIDHLYRDPHNPETRMFLHYGDLTDGSSMRRIIHKIQPDEIYNLGAQSHVKVSFEQAEYTADVVATGTLRLLEALRDYIEVTGRPVRIYQAGSSEMFGPVQENVPVTHLGERRGDFRFVGQVAAPLIESPDLHQRSHRDIERAFTLPAVLEAGRKELEKLRRNLDRPEPSVPIDLAPLASGLIVRKQLVESPDLVERSVRRRLHLDPVIAIQGNGIGRTHGVGALFESQKFLLPVSRRKRQQKQN